MAYYKTLLDYVQALEREGLLFRVGKAINKDTEMHPLVRWQFRGLDESQRRAFYFDNIHDAKGKKYDIPVLIGGLAGSQRIYALGLMCKEEEVERVWSRALEKPIEPRCRTSCIRAKSLRAAAAFICCRFPSRRPASTTRPISRRAAGSPEVRPTACATWAFTAARSKARSRPASCGAASSTRRCTGSNRTSAACRSMRRSS